MTTQQGVRVRFAPSPTGELHVGGARTALFNWLFARQYSGKMILRIDDTDKERSRKEYLDSIINSMTWLGLDWDEGPIKGGEYGPYFQSEREDIYEKAVAKLLEDGKAYYCFCTDKELAEAKEKSRQEGKPPRYDGRCRNLPVEEVDKKIKDGQAYVLRLKVPEEGEMVVDDIIRGQVVFQNSDLGDFIIVKSDGSPVYNFASVVDDSLMRISHVIRAEEHLSNTPRQQLIAEHLGYDLPRYAHVPMILAPDYGKLSKRHGATSVSEYRDKGILPQALVNYLVLLGWSPGEDKEILTTEEMIQLFSLEKVTKNPSVYDIDKLTWLNGHYLRTLDIEEITDGALPFLVNAGVISSESAAAEDREKIKAVVELVRDRVKTLQEVAEASYYFFRDDFDYEEKGVKKHFAKKDASRFLEMALRALKEVDLFEPSEIKKALEKISEEQGVSPGKINPSVRLAVTGKTMGPDLFETMALLGKEKVQERIKKAVEFCNAQSHE